ncbi:PepSY domain-containing protein [Mucilaginibacter sp. BT774]|uniref:PepSY-associated TM helix domain-containing protein n=1 Tax=Mucilaginibacter sp. BT774 TaxID=3062276 RepID=UPI0026761467|nr:PepSY-associated TM helix domain-containing protein [Mucilaginibacter sp. BT774]MDO3626376.1 PepSY-associated TM helix domain-containing protein [Mucilaginibacter sp. BT774]
MHKFVFKLHLYASLILCPLILVFAITGCFMAFEPEIDHWVHRKLSYVEPRRKALSIADIANTLNKEYPHDTIVGYHLSTFPGISYQVYTNIQTIYINQYNGKVLGTMAGPDFWQKAQNIIHQLHLRLAFRDNHDTGKLIMSWTGVVLLIILPSGLFLWWKQKRVSIRASGQSRQKWFDLHSMIGIFSFVFIMISVITGVIIGFENKTTPLLNRITSSKSIERPEFKIVPQTNVKQISPDRALQLARLTLPGASPFDINIPGQTEAYSIRCRYPEDLTPGGRSMVMIDPYSTKVLFIESSRTAPTGTRIKIANRAIHTGDIFGVPSKILGLLVCLALCSQIVSGARMWWLRKIKKAIK